MTRARSSIRTAVALGSASAVFLALIDARPAHGQAGQERTLDTTEAPGLPSIAVDAQGAATVAFQESDRVMRICTVRRGSPVAAGCESSSTLQPPPGSGEAFFAAAKPQIITTTAQRFLMYQRGLTANAFEGRIVVRPLIGGQTQGPDERILADSAAGGIVPLRASSSATYYNLPAGVGSRGSTPTSRRATSRRPAHRRPASPTCSAVL